MKRVALVTGIAKGIGTSIALSLARDGYDIIATYNTNKELALKVKERIERIGVKASIYKLDVTSNRDINNLYKHVVKEYKNIDVLINNAALSMDNEFNLKTKEEFMRVLEVNLVGPFLMIQKFNNIIDGTIINIASTDGINTYSSLSIDYSSSKAGLINMTKNLAECLDNRVIAICPNWVNTESIREMNPDYLESEMKRVGQFKLIDPKEVANKVIEVLESDYNTGSIIIMEG